MINFDDEYVKNGKYLSTLIVQELLVYILSNSSPKSALLWKPLSLRCHFDPLYFFFSKLHLFLFPILCVLCGACEYLIIFLLEELRRVLL